MASTIKCKLYSEMMSGQFKAAPVIENILSPALPNLNVQPENKEKAKYDVTDLLEAKKLENWFFSVITSSEAQIEAEKKVQSTQLVSRRHHLPWRDILAAAILLLCVGTFALTVNSILQFLG